MRLTIRLFGSDREASVGGDSTGRREALVAWFHCEFNPCVHDPRVRSQCEAWADQFLATGPADHPDDDPTRDLSGGDLAGRPLEVGSTDLYLGFTNGRGE